jgi:O-antigen ligase/tetratricopeptide (TPR) repeat protein
MKDVLKAIVIGGIFAVPFLTLYVENDYFFPFITGKNFWFRIIVDVSFVAWVLLALYEPKYRPKWSWLVGGFGALLVVMFFANLFGAHTSSSFWSNFERMDGYVSLVHTFMYFVILGSVMLNEKLWRRLLNVSLAVAFAVALYGLAQYTGVVDGTNRIDSRLGNAAYMAVYMLFHIFIAFWLFVESKKVHMKMLFALLAIMFTFVLIETGTRGTAIGLAVGVFVMSGYIAIFGKQFKEFRKYAIGAFVLLLLVVGGFVAGKDTDFVQDNKNFRRIANISLEDLEIRSIIWGTAIQGAAERPLLGYGQSNFNFVFNANYDPRLYAQEQWFDRGHNIFIDWLITGGALGLVAYLSIFVAFVWYLLFRPITRNDESFTVLERGVLLGILAGYFTHNLVVFDNIISYIFFAIILGLVHSRVGTPIPQITNAKVDNAIITQFAAPVLTVVLFVGMYFAHSPGMLAAGDIIDGFREPDPLERLEHFKRAIDRDSFAYQEVVEQLAQQTITIVRDQRIDTDTKDLYASYTEEQINKLIEWKPGDARIHVFAGTYYRSVGRFDQAAVEMARARELSPKKQAVIIQQGFVELSRNNLEAAIRYFEDAFLLDERNLEAREYYAAALIQAGRGEEAIALMDSPKVKSRFARSDYLISNANRAGMTDFLLELFETRVADSPDVVQNWATWAFLQHQNGDKEGALDTLKRGSERLPEFVPLANCVSDNIENDREPTEGCE